MTHSSLFLGLTGSIAVRTVGKLIETAHRSGFQDVSFHPTSSALPFLVESILHDFPETCKHLPNPDLTDELTHRVASGSPINHISVQNWFDSLGAINGKPRRLAYILDSYESWEEQSGILSREKGSVRHIDIARKSQAALIAPATANTIAKIVNGTTDNFLLQVIRAMDSKGNAPVFIAPAMNTEMLHDPFTRKNLTLLKNEGKPKYHVLPTEEKILQCWEYGDGAMLDIDEIFKRVRKTLEIIPANHTS